LFLAAFVLKSVNIRQDRRNVPPEVLLPEVRPSWPHKLLGSMHVLNYERDAKYFVNSVSRKPERQIRLFAILDNIRPRLIPTARKPSAHPPSPQNRSTHSGRFSARTPLGCCFSSDAEESADIKLNPFVLPEVYGVSRRPGVAGSALNLCAGVIPSW
jgi:hypothetical protein